jgi:hypothetical protein
VRARSEVTCTLTGTTRQKRPAAAAAVTLALQTSDEFASLASLPFRDPPVPISLTSGQVYCLLEELVLLGFSELTPLDYCLVTAKQAPERLPRRLLMPDVILVSDSQPEQRRLSAEGLNLLTIRNGLVRHSFDAGDNRVHLTWESCGVGEELWLSFVAKLSGLGLSPLRPAEPVSSWSPPTS